MTDLLFLALVAAGLLTWWAGRYLFRIVRTDGYGFRSSSGLPRDWAPAELPSTPYTVKPHF
ncbi:MAG: hypothetical protein WKF82_01710 [Nocardioidaceae bacterium]